MNLDMMGTDVVATYMETQSRAVPKGMFEAKLRLLNRAPDVETGYNLTIAQLSALTKRISESRFNPASPQYKSMVQQFLAVLKAFLSKYGFTDLEDIASKKPEWGEQIRALLTFVTGKTQGYLDPVEMSTRTIEALEEQKVTLAPMTLQHAQVLQAQGYRIASPAQVRELEGALTGKTPATKRMGAMIPIAIAAAVGFFALTR